MSSTAEETKYHAEIIQHETGDGTGYVIYIFDWWEGNRNDPAVSVHRFIAVYDGEAMEEDPDFAVRSRYRYGIGEGPDVKPVPLHMATLGTTKEADRDALEYKNAMNRVESEGHRAFGSASSVRFNDFATMIERVAANPEDEEAWEKIEEYRMWQATKNDK